LLPVLQLGDDRSRKLSRRLRKVTRRLGDVRELDVLLLLIDELHESQREHGSALSRLAVAVAKERDDARTQMLERLPVAKLRKLSRKLVRAVGEVEAAEAQRSTSTAARGWKWAVDARVAARADRLGKAIEEAGAVYLPERLHAVRIEVKKLRYAVELSAA